MKKEKKTTTVSHVFGWACVVYSVILLTSRFYTINDNSYQQPYSFMWWIYTIPLYLVALRAVFFCVKVFTPRSIEYEDES